MLLPPPLLQCSVQCRLTRASAFRGRSQRAEPSPLGRLGPFPVCLLLTSSIPDHSSWIPQKEREDSESHSIGQFLPKVASTWGQFFIMLSFPLQVQRHMQLARKLLHRDFLCAFFVSAVPPHFQVGLPFFLKKKVSSRYFAIK